MTFGMNLESWTRSLMVVVMTKEKASFQITTLWWVIWYIGEEEDFFFVVARENVCLMLLLSQVAWILYFLNSRFNRMNLKWEMLRIIYIMCYHSFLYYMCIIHNLKNIDLQKGWHNLPKRKKTVTFCGDLFLVFIQERIMHSSFPSILLWIML